MSPSKSQVTVSVADGSTGLTIVDHQLRTVANGFGRIAADLEPGLYKARSRVGAESVEQFFEVGPDGAPVTVSLEPVSFSSPIPLAHTRTTHEYQERAAQQVAGAPSVHAGEGAEFLLLVRDPGMMEDQPPPGDLGAYTRALSAFSLRRISDGETVVDGSSAMITNTKAGYAIVRAALTPGAYVLSSEPPAGPRRHQAVYMIAGRRTDVFISCNRTSDSEAPLRPAMDDVAMSMPSMTSTFDPYDPTLRLLEVARQALGRGRRVLEPDAVKEFIDHAPGNPMLALYAAYLARFDENAVKAGLADRAISAATMTLGDTVPDVTILRSAAGGVQSRSSAIETPPLLWPSWILAVRPKGDRLAGLVAGRSFAQSIAGDVLPGGNWLAWDTPEWKPETSAPSLSEQVARLRKVTMLSRSAPGIWGSVAIATSSILGTVGAWVGAVAGIGVLAYWGLRSRQLDFARLSQALVSVPWDNLAETVEVQGLSRVQRALLPTLVAVGNRTANPRSRVSHPEAIVSDALAQLNTTPEAIVEAVMGLLETAVRIKTANPRVPELTRNA